MLLMIIKDILIIYLMLSTFGINFSRQHFEIFLFLPEKGLSGKNKKKSSICCLLNPLIDQGSILALANLLNAGLFPQKASCNFYHLLILASWKDSL